MIRTDKIFLSNNLGWTIEVSKYGDAHEWVAYAICPKQECRTKLDFSEGKKEATCVKCGDKYAIEKDYEMIRGEVNQKFEGSKLWMSDVINLDLLPTKLAAGNEDDSYWVQVRIGQKNGKRTAVVYIGEKIKEQTKKDYVQLFIDLDDEQLRFDKGNMHPMKLLSRLEVNFPEHTTEVSKNKN